MLLQTNSYIVPKEKMAEHSRLIRRFRQTLLRLGCDHFEVYQQVGSNWSPENNQSRYVQILRFLDRKHQLAVQAAERTDPTAQAVISDFCELINFPYQQQQGLFAVGFYTSVLPVQPKRGVRGELVSTVEHEVVDDPGAEQPYPGSSDGPPLDTPDESIPNDPAVAETPMDEPVEAPATVAEDEFSDVDLDEPISEPEPVAEKVSEKIGEPSALEKINEDEFSLEPLESPAAMPAIADAVPAATEEPLEELEEPLDESWSDEAGPSMHMKMDLEPARKPEPQPQTEPEPLAELEPEELLEPLAEEPVSEETATGETATEETLSAVEPATKLEPAAGLEPVEELDPVEELEPLHEPEAELQPTPKSEPEPEPLAELEPEELLELDPHTEPAVAAEPAAEWEPELEPEAELEPEVEPEPVKPRRPATPPPLARPAQTHTDDFMNLVDGELTEEDEERAHGFIEGELVDELENENVDGEELTGHEVQPVPKHKSKNAPSPW